MPGSNQPIAADTVKVYFIEPIKSISVVMDVLIKLNFEVYAVPEADSYRLVPIIKKHPRNVVYFCLVTEQHAARWLEYVDYLAKVPQSQNQFGVFVSPNVNQPTRSAFLNRGVATIDLFLFQNNTLETLKKILLYFEAREKRKFVRARAFGNCQVFFKMKNLNDAIKSELVEISIHAFSCRIESDAKVFFSRRDYIQDVTIILRGKRLRLSACFMGFDQTQPNVAVFVSYFPLIVNNQVEYHQQLPQEIRKSIFDFILSALKEDIKQQLAEMPEERPTPEPAELI